MELFDQLNQKHIDFIAAQQLFFVATAGAEGRVNLSPKGLDSLRVLDTQTVHWLNLTGSGNETAAHVFENKRMTLMFCSFDRQPLILRVYGDARIISPQDSDWPESYKRFNDFQSARQIFHLTVDLVQTSCGYGVPFYEHQGARDTLIKWADKKTPQEISDYQQTKNRLSLDGKPTGLPKI